MDYFTYSVYFRYYAILFLNQIILTHHNVELSQKLIEIYFRMFKVLIGQKSDVESKMLSALLTGVNRAFPFSRVAPEAYANNSLLFTPKQKRN
jgi:ribosome biogenesis protein MAK21